MPAYTIQQAFAEATPEACKALIKQGINFAVAVETAVGEWGLLHAEDPIHANDVAHAWVDYHEARGASIWRIYFEGLANQKCGMVLPQIEWED